MWWNFPVEARSAFDDDTDYRRRFVKEIATHCFNARRLSTQTADDLRRLLYFFTRASPLDGEDLSRTLKEWHGERGEPGQRGHSASCNNIYVRLSDSLLSATAKNLHVLQAEILGHLAKPVHSSFEGLNQEECSIRSGDGKSQPRQAGTTTDISNARRLWNQFTDNRTVKDMPVPQARQLARSEKTSLDP
ncbi:hypothetical protein GCM10009784_11440 [Arthrobacter parietis]|uniref:Uncharacterized protein n=1 Tax=Arthrobacter parietis TaxID=271434 RepID=A0ABN3ASR7_9MICC